ncbi:MAG TPA: glycosyltransferase family 39 protein [Anaerolineae bacterium]|nr:glycosyltransferase family 39 protein [Anaerolineae bacterium]
MLAKAASWFEVSILQPPLLIGGLSLSLASRAAAGDGLRVFSPLANLLWLAGIALTIAGCWRWKERDLSNSGHPAHSGSTNRWEAIWIAGIFIVSLILRGWAADRMPYVLNDEEASIGLVGWEFVAGERDNLLSSTWGSFPTLYFWLLSVSQTLFGRTINAIRWVSAFGGALTVIALYWAAREMFGRKIAIWSAAWLIAFHHHLFFSRVAYHNIWDGFFLILTAGAFWKGWVSDRRGYYLLAGLAIGLGQFFYITSRVIPIVILLWSFLLFRHSPTRERKAAHLCCLGLVATAVVLPLALHYAAHPEQWFLNAQNVSILVPDLKEAANALGTTPIGLVLEQIWVTILGLTVAELQGVYYECGAPLLIGLSTPLFLLGVILSFIRLRDPRYNLPLLTLITTILIGGISTQAPNAQRMLLLPPMLAMFLVFPLEEISTRLSFHWPKGRIFLLITMSGLILIAMAQNLRHFYKDYLPREAYGSYKGEVAQGMVEILENEKQGTEVYLVSGGRLHLDSLTSLRYQLTEVAGWNLEPPYILPDSAGPVGTRRLFFILPEQVDARLEIEAKYTDGSTFPRYNRHGQLLFYVGSIGQP